LKNEKDKKNRKDKNESCLKKGIYKSSNLKKLNEK
jgi:hypothetical protein